MLFIGGNILHCRSKAACRLETRKCERNYHALPYPATLRVQALTIINLFRNVQVGVD